MEFRLLGPLEVVDDAGCLVGLGPPRQRALLAALCLHVGEPLTADRLIDLLWGERLPATATTILHGSVAGLRKALEPDRGHRAVPRLLVLGPDGYRLDVDPGRVDLVAFERLVDAGRRELKHDAARAERALRQALGLWRGRAFGAIEADFAVEASARLEEVRLDVVEMRADALLALDRHDEVAVELGELVQSHPLRERMTALLMAGLQRSGRTTEALRLYDDLRGHLSRELGVDPSSSVRRFHEAILEGDDTLPGLAVTEQPSGVVTFLLLDIKGSSSMWERDPARMDSAHQRFQQIVRSCARGNRGVLPVEQGEGDSAVLAFGRATDAATCALDLQRTLGTEPWPEGAEIKVRIALHTGEAELRDGTYYGIAINRCARLRALAHGGQVLLSSATADLAGDALPDRAELIDLGPHRLRDLARAERVWQLVHPELVRHFPALTGAVGRHNLPAPITSLIGRSAERDDVCGLLADHRLVTLCGPGGSGKTRLAVEISRHMSERLGGGVWLVELAELSSAELVVQSVAKAVGVRAEAGRTLVDTVSASLSDEESLVVLDNCEHVLDACATLTTQILAGGGAARVLTTSREPLGIPGEVVFAVGPLTVGAAEEPWDRIAASDGVRLFAERGSATRPGFGVDESNAHVVGDICRRLDGMPLAIELAAARVSTTPLRRIAERLDDRFRLLDSVTRSPTPRHRSLAATVEWSYDLLDDDERALFDQLAVFSGSFTLEAAEAVVEVGPTGVAALLSRLVSRSLVEMTAHDERYRLLETLREYGRARLAMAARSRAAQERHARHYLRIAEHAWPRLREAGSALWYRELAADEPNIRAALEWAFGSDGDNDVGIRIACAMWFFWDVRGADGESAHWLAAGLRVADHAPPTQRAVLLSATAQLSMRKGDYDAGEEMADVAVALVRHLVDDGSADAVEIVSAAAFPRGIVPWARGEFARATHVIEEALETSLAAGRDWYSIQLEYLLARVLRDAQDLDAAETMAARALARAEALGEDIVLGNCADLSASLARRRGDLEFARALVAVAHEHFRATGYREGEASVLSEAGRLALDSGEVDAAAEAFAQALGLCRRLGHRAGMAAAMEGLARVLGSIGDASGAAMLWGGASELRRQIGAPMPAVEQADQSRELQRLAEVLGDEIFSEAAMRGATLPLDGLVELSADRRLGVV